MMIYEIPGPPIPCQRPKFSRGRCYDPQAKKKKELQFFIQKMAEAHLYRAGALKLVIEYQMPIPKSWSVKKSLKHHGAPHVSRPDLSNLIKFTEDALNGIVWEDDALIYELHCRKFYSNTPKTVFMVEENPSCRFESLMGRHLEVGLRDEREGEEWEV